LVQAEDTAGFGLPARVLGGADDSQFHGPVVLPHFLYQL
jgi:hypothetical protein